MRIVVISDTHGAHAELHVPVADVLIHAGDVASHGDRHEIEDFLLWFGQLDARHKIFVAGNHDRFIEAEPELFRRLLPASVQYLQDSGTVIDGVRFWGCPMTPSFYDWAFMADIGPALGAHWQLIPTDINILITHGPPYGILDEVMYEGAMEKAGCPDLLETVVRLQPDYHLFGHIHEGYGQFRHAGVEFINASCMNERYQLTNTATVIDYNRLIKST